MGYLGMFRESQEEWARNFDPGVNKSRKTNPGTLCPTPACDRVKSIYVELGLGKRFKWKKVRVNVNLKNFIKRINLKMTKMAP